MPEYRGKLYEYAVALTAEGQVAAGEAIRLLLADRDRLAAEVARLRAAAEPIAAYYRRAVELNPAMPELPVAILFSSWLGSWTAPPPISTSDLAALAAALKETTP